MLPDNFYHIYNRTNGKEKLFLVADNYYYFLRQLKKYISPIADFYAYCLILNHFHFVIKIKSEEELELFFEEKLKNRNENLSKGFEPSNEQDLQGFQNLGGLISQQFSNFFNSYSKAFNKMHNRKGSLFAPNFKKKLITDKTYLQQVILYVHLNPVKHQLSLDFSDYPYSSYESILSEQPTLIKRKEVLSLFDDEDNFKFVHHEQKVKTALIAEIIKEDN